MPKKKETVPVELTESEIRFLQESIGESLDMAKNTQRLSELFGPGFKLGKRQRLATTIDLKLNDALKGLGKGLSGG